MLCLESAVNVIPANVYRFPPPVRLEGQLKPADAKVFRVLREAAAQRPDAFLSMQEIAAQAFGQPEWSASKIKNVVQRSIYEIRQRFGRDSIVNHGAQYRLELPAAPAAQPPTQWEAPEGAGQFTSGPGFPARVREVLERAASKEGSPLSRLTFFGDGAVTAVEECASQLASALRACKTVRILGPDAQQIIDLLLKCSAAFDGQLDYLDGFLELFVTACPGSAGFAWVDRHDDNCTVELCGALAKPTVIAVGGEARAYLQRSDDRWNQMEAEFKPPYRTLRLDAYDLLLQRNLPAVRQYATLRGVSASRSVQQLLAKCI